MFSTAHSRTSDRRSAVMLAAALCVVAALVLVPAGWAGAQDGTPELAVSLPGFDVDGELDGQLVEVVLSSSAAIADVELVGTAPLIVLDGDRPGPSTFSVRDAELLSAFLGETVEAVVVTRINSESPGVGAPSTAQIDTAFSTDVNVAYGYVALVVDAGILGEESATIAAGSDYELNVDLSNGGNLDLVDVVVAEAGTVLCEIGRLPAGGADQCVAAATAATVETSIERTVVVSASPAGEPSTTVSASVTVAITVAPDQDEVLGVVTSQSDDAAEDEQGDPDEDASPEDEQGDPDEDASPDDADDGELAHTGAGTEIFAALGLAMVALGLAARSEGRTIRRRIELR